MNDWIHLALHIITIVLVWQVYEIVKNIRKVQSGEIGGDTMQEFTTELLKGKDEHK